MAWLRHGVWQAEGRPAAVPSVCGWAVVAHLQLGAVTLTSYHDPSLLQAGTRSAILQWEKQYLLDNGVPPNAELAEVVQAISYFQ